MRPRLGLDQRMNAAAPGLVQEDGFLPRLAVVETPAHVDGQHEVLPIRVLRAPVPARRRFQLLRVHPRGDDHAVTRAQQGALVADAVLLLVAEDRRRGPRPAFIAAVQRVLRIHAQHPAIARGDKRPLMRERQRRGLRMQRRSTILGVPHRGGQQGQQQGGGGDDESACGCSAHGNVLSRHQEDLSLISYAPQSRPTIRQSVSLGSPFPRLSMILLAGTSNRKPHGRVNRAIPRLRAVARNPEANRFL